MNEPRKMSPEGRQNLSAAMKESWAKRKSASASPPSVSSPPSSAAPPSLPRAPRSAAPSDDAMTRMLGMLEALQKRDEATPLPKRPQLPDDADQRDRALQVARIPARMPVTAIDELFRGFDVRPLSAQEREEGIEAWAALFWYYGLTDPRLLVLLWMLGVAAPRIGDAVQKKRGASVAQPKLAPPSPPAQAASAAA